MNLLEAEPGLVTAISGRPTESMESPAVEPVMLIELMGDGHAIEKNPTPAASIVANEVAAEAILQRLFGPAEGDEGQNEERFTPYALIGEPEEIYGGIKVISGDTEGADAFIRKLIGSVQRPSDDKLISTQESAADERVRSEEDEDRTGSGKNMLLALRRSKLGKAVAGAAFVASGALYWASSASAATLEQTCVDAGTKPMDIKVDKVHDVHRHHGNGWYGRVIGQINAMPSECADNGYYRVLNTRTTEQNGEHRQQWRNVVPWEGNNWNGHNKGFGLVSNNAIYGVGYGFSNGTYQHNHNFTGLAYICSPGPAKTGFRFQTMNTVIHTDGTISDYGSEITGDIQIVGPRKVTTHNMKVDGAC